MSTRLRHHRILHRWADELGQYLPLSKPQALGLALWSIGIVLAKSGMLTSVALALSVWLDSPRLNLIKRLREWYLQAQAKKGAGSHGRGQKRRDFSVELCAPALARWILSRWHAAHLPLVLDATSLGDRFTVLAISLAYRRCAIPLIWTVLPGNTPGAWNPHWERMIAALAGWIGEDRFVLALTDRGLYSPKLFQALVDAGWHPLMRIRAQGYYRPTGQRAWRPLANLRPPLDQQQAWTGEAFKNTEGRLHCTLVAWWTEGHDEPWLLLTDLAVARVQGRWYALRGWIEQSFKRLKSGGWNCERTRMSDAERVSRHWLALAVAMLWTVSVGGQAEAAEEAEGPAEAEEASWPEDLLHPASDPAPAAAPDASPAKAAESPLARTVGVFLRGWTILSQALSAGRLPRVKWYPEPLAGLDLAHAGFS